MLTNTVKSFRTATTSTARSIYTSAVIFTDRNKENEEDASKNIDSATNGSGSTIKKTGLDSMFKHVGISSIESQRHRRLRGRLLSPEDRLKNMLSSTGSNCGDNQDQSSKTVSSDFNAGLNNEIEGTSDQIKTNKDHQRKRSTVKPVDRLVEMIPDNYWEDVDSDTKSTIDNLKTDEDENDKES